jgi:hypothetical protein
MPWPTESWSESSPAGSDQINAGDNSIRKLKTQIREVIDVDHDFPSSGQATTTGQHKQVTLQEQADIGSGAEGVPILGAQTIDTKPELVYTDEDDNDIQMTIKGTPVAINGCTAKTTPVVADLLLLCDSADSYKSKKLTLANLLNVVYPVGSVYTNYSVSTNPGTLLGVGTWIAIEGRVVVGIDATQTEFDTAGETGGEKTHALTEAELASHSHGVTTYTRAGFAGSAIIKEAPTGGAETLTTQATGSGTAHNNLQPYVVCYVWRRTA